jgi:hypothetical protein
MNGQASSRRRVTLIHHAGLDGLRGVAVLGVLLYHGGASWAPGGFLGVEIFFALSGFLITSLLGELDVNGTWEGQSAGCSTELSTWAREEKATQAQQVVVELGYRDEFNWRIDGKVVHLGQPAFDGYVRSQINHFVSVLGAGGVKVLFLSVPYTDPPDLPDGSPAPAASASRHALINSMLESAARAHPGKVSVLDIDKTISPGESLRRQGRRPALPLRRHPLQPVLRPAARAQRARRHPQDAPDALIRRSRPTSPTLRLGRLQRR